MKRKTTLKKGRSPESKRSVTRSFWRNGETMPIPAINPSRPFDFQVGIPDSDRPYEFGQLQYVVTEFAVPDDWYASDAFTINVQHLFQAIRENLRSNLSYSEDTLFAYLANVTWLQAIFSTIQRDFAFKYFRDSQHPTFEKVWGRVYEGEPQSALDPLAPSVQVLGTTSKQYLSYEDYATSLTFIETVLIPQSRLLLLPPAVSEYMKWLCGSVFTDETDPSRGQFYWNEIRSIPIYDSSMNIITRLDTANLTLDELSQVCTMISSTFGTIIADLRRCGAQMVTPEISVEGIRNPIMRYDEVFFTMLENAYSHGSRRPHGGEITEVLDDTFTIDIMAGMSDDQICTALSMLGALDTSENTSVPMTCVGQYAIVLLDETTSIYPSPYLLNVDGSIGIPQPVPAGIYALFFFTATGGYVAIDSAGSIVPATNIASNSSVFVGPGYYSYQASTTNSDYISSLVGDSQLKVIAFATLGVEYSLYFVLADSSTEKVVVHEGSPSELYESYDITWNGTTPSNLWKGSGQVLDLYTEGEYDSVSSAAQDIPISIHFKASRYSSPSTPLPMRKWNYTLEAAFGQNPTAYVTTAALNDIHCLGSMTIGTEMQADVSQFRVDPSSGILPYMLEEISHHIPVWHNLVTYSIDNARALASTTPVLVKKTRVSTTYTRVELEAFMYQLYYSLFAIHAAGKARDAKSYKEA